MPELYCAPAIRRGVLQAICDKKSLKFQLPLAFSMRLVQPSQTLARAVGGINLNFAPQAKYIGRAWIGTLRARGAFAQRVRIIAARIPISLLFVRLNMRSISILALLLIVVGVQPAWAQPPSGYCRIYRCMTMGTSTYYYCLKCSNCSDPVGCVGLWNDATGPCPTDCSAMHCGGAQAPTGRPGAAPPHPDRAPAPPGLDERPASRPIRAPFVAELTAAADEPELLIGEYTKLIQRLNLSIDIPDDGQGAINALLVTAVVEPKKKNSNDHHKKVILGFAVPYTGDLSNYLEVEAYEVDVQGQSASFKFKEKLTGLQHEKHCTIDLSSLMP